MIRPERGDVWIVDLGLAAKIQPCLVLSVPALPDERALVAHTTGTRASRFEVMIAAPFLRSGAFDAQNLVTVPRVKLLHKIGELDIEELTQVEAAVRAWLGL